MKDINPAAPAEDLPHTRLTWWIDTALIRVSEWSSWIWLLLLAVIVTNVTLRYLFAEGRIELEEIQWHLYSVGFLLALAGGVARDSHIRVDVVHERLSPQLRAWIEVYGILLLFIPFCLVILIYSVPFVIDSYTRNEASLAPGGLGSRWLIKLALPIGFLLMLLGGLSRLLRALQLLFSTQELR